MCDSRRPLNGADSGEYPPLTAGEALNVYVADSIVRNNPSGWREWLRAKAHALQEERVAIVERLIEDRLIPGAFEDSARRIALDPTVDLEDGLPPRAGRMRTDPYPRPYTARRP